jgi:chromosome segregation ATPase
MKINVYKQFFIQSKVLLQIFPLIFYLKISSDTLENVDDVNSIVDTILKLRQDHLTLTSELNKTNDKMHVENEKLLLNIHQQQSTIDEYIQTNNQLEKRLVDNEQQIINLKQEIQDNIHQYQRLQNEYQLYKEDNQIKKSKKSI